VVWLAKGFFQIHSLNTYDHLVNVRVDTDRTCNYLFSLNNTNGLQVHILVW